MKNKILLRNINRMAYPVLLNYLLLSAFEIFDKAIVGHYSIRGFAVVGIAEAPVYEITGALGILSAAFGMIAAELKGKRDTEMFEKAFDISRKFSVMIGLAFFVLSLAGGRFFFQYVYGVEGKDLEELLSYFYPAAFTVVQNMLVFLYSAYYRNCLNTRISFWSTVTATMVNLFFDASLVYGLFGFPQLGTAGAAWGSIIGLWAGLLVYQIPYYRNRVGYKAGRLERQRIIKRLLKLYPPLLGQEFLESTIFVLIVSGVVAGMGARHMAVYSLLAAVGNMMELPIYAYATASQTYALQNKSADNTEQAGQYLKVGQRLAIFVVTLLGILCIIGRTSVFGMIISDKHVIAYAGNFLVWAVIIALSKVPYQFRMGYLQGIGKENYVFICTVVVTVIASGAVMIFGKYFALPGIYLVVIGKYVNLSMLLRRRITDE